MNRLTQANDYHFVSRWRVEGTCGEVADVLGDPLALARWWPSVYLAVEELRPADARGVGRRVTLHTKGWLPYTLTWEFEVVESRYPYGFTLVAAGDFNGRGEWTFAQDGPVVDITYDWRISAEKPLLRRLSFVLKPLFEANHRWAMAQGETSLTLELARRRALSDAARAQVPPPPGPVTYAAVALLAGAAVVGAGLAYLVLRSTRRR
jgi:polyketide cyclase/dehydrase/lipid transport protein